MTTTTTAGYPAPVNIWNSGTLPHQIVASASVASAPVLSRLNISQSRVDQLFNQAKKKTPLNNTTIYVRDSNIKTIRYSQDSVAARTSDGILLNTLAAIIREEGWNNSSPIQVVKMPDGKLTSKDNRRLRAAKQVVTQTVTTGKVGVATSTPLKISARAFDHSIPAPKKELGSYRFAYRKHIDEEYPDYAADYRFNQIPLPDLSEYDEALEYGTYGEEVILRMNSGQGDTSYRPLGFTNDPIVRDYRY